MADEKATSAYLIAELFDRAVNLVRRVLAAANLKIVGWTCPGGFSEHC